MSEQSVALTDAVTDVANKFDMVNATLQTAMQQIADALAGAGDADLRQAANDAVARLGAVASQLEAMNTTVQGIVP